MNYIRVKTNIQPPCIEDRLRYNPEIVELHLELADLEPDSGLIPTIRRLQDKGCRVYLHQPPRVHGRFQDILTTDDTMYEAYVDSARRLADICRTTNVKSVIHAHYKHPPEAPEHQVTLANTKRLRERIEETLSYGADCFLWEDTTGGLFSYANPLLLEHVIEPLCLPLNVDVSHAFIALGGDNERLRKALAATAPFAAYYHLVDSMGEKHDSLPLGQGRIDWTMVAPFVRDRDFIFEIQLPGDHSDCTLMLESAEVFRQVLHGHGKLGGASC